MNLSVIFFFIRTRDLRFHSEKHQLNCMGSTKKKDHLLLSEEDLVVYRQTFINKYVCMYLHFFSFAVTRQLSIIVFFAGKTFF